MAIMLAIAIWGAFIARSMWLFFGDEPAPPTPTAIQVQVVELPPPAPDGAAKSHTEPKNVPLRTVVPKPVSNRPAKPRARVPALAPVTPIEAARSDAALAAQQPATRTQSEHAVVGDARPASATNAESEPTHSASSGNAQARLISQALPTLPDDLREEGYQAVAVARFLVRADGTFDIDLIKPTRNPRLNQILLETLRRWRFFPAMENGRPVESRQDVRVHFNVD